MDEENLVAPTETAQNEDAETPQQAAEPEIDWKAQAAKNEQAFKDQQSRAKKAEQELKKLREQGNPSEKSGTDLSTKDILTLSGKGITDEEDIDWLTDEVAPLYGGSVAKALNAPVVASMLAARKEERQTAAAASSTPSRRAVTERSTGELLSQASKGVLPESKADVRRIIRAKIGIADK